MGRRDEDAVIDRGGRQTKSGDGGTLEVNVTEKTFGSVMEATVLNNMFK